MDKYTKDIYASGGQWSETEVEGNRAIVKIDTIKPIIDKLDLEFIRLPDDFMTNLLAQQTYFKPRRKPRYDEKTDEIVLDGDIIQPKPLETLDSEI